VVSSFGFFDYALNAVLGTYTVLLTFLFLFFFFGLYLSSSSSIFLSFLLTRTSPSPFLGSFLLNSYIFAVFNDSAIANFKYLSSPSSLYGVYPGGKSS
jgi:hypothetical protein